mmetsp:Transcript_3120/g.7814  ORF Transcript_3120/g.7814 Transcript_3120/m.7814 type:complete len:285 (-) Transcript_3120:388-1242(-)
MIQLPRNSTAAFRASPPPSVHSCRQPLPVVRGRADRLHHAAHPGQVRGLSHQRERRVRAAHAQRRRLQPRERAPADGGHDLGAKPACEGCFVAHDQPPCAPHALLHQAYIPGHECAQVQHVARDALLSRHLARGRLQHQHLLPPPHQRDVMARSHAPPHTQRDGVPPLRHLLHCGAIHHLGLKEHHRVGVLDGAEQQPLGLCRAGGDDHLEAGHVREEGLGALAVVVPAVAHSAVGRTHGEAAAVEHAPAAVPVLGRLVHQLVKGGEDVVGKLDLCDSGVPHDS